MAKGFIDKDFLLGCDAARELYHGYAELMPVIDWHNHLSPGDMACDRRYGNIGQLWVVSDPYKHRAMRLNGIPERFISGDASGREKFDAWAETCPYTAGNPLYHWSALELERVFGIDILLDSGTAQEIWDRCNAMLAEDRWSTLGIMRKWNVDVLCTSDGLLSDVGVHLKATEKAGTFRVLPSLRGDSILSFGTEENRKLIAGLSETVPVDGLDSYLAAISARMDVFGSAGCRLSDHALDSGFCFVRTCREQAERIFAGYLADGNVTADDKVYLSSYMLGFLAGEYARRGWVMQLHIGAERHTSSRLRSLAGPAGGYATIGQSCDIRSLVDFIDGCDSVGRLPKTIIYTLNPADNAAFATLTGSFSEDGVWGKVQSGPAWWYNDHKDGIENCLKTVSSYSLLWRNLGMTTDSRSILSFSRHEYFRRILCGYIGGLVEAGELPPDIQMLGKMVQDISYNNAKEWIFSE